MWSILNFFILLYIIVYIIRLLLCIIGIYDRDTWFSTGYVDTKQDVKNLCNPLYGITFVKKLRTKYNSLLNE